MNNRTIAAVILAALLGTLVGFSVSYAWFQSLVQPEPYVHSQLLANRTLTSVDPDGKAEDWVANWTLTRSIRVVRIQVWMGNPDTVTWESDTFVTVGQPISPYNASSYTNVIHLLAHYQFDSHTQSATPHQLMFDLTPGFKVTSGQTIHVYRLFHNTGSTQVQSGDVEVIIYYENL
jgi:hypothetical protein